MQKVISILHSEYTKLCITGLDLIPASHSSLQAKTKVPSSVLGRNDAIILQQISITFFKFSAD